MIPDEPILAVVVITRNEARHIGACLESIMQVVAMFPATPVVVVDSDSSDATVAIATRYPVTVYRYRAARLTAAAGRHIGFQRVQARYVLFVDGDCRIEAHWVQIAVALLEESPDAAVLYGARREIVETASSELRSAEVSPETYSLGGNALYRSAILRQVGGFHPFIIAEEEAELLGRIQVAGYRAIRTPEVMVTHFTAPQDTPQGFLRRHRGGLTRGYGQVLRIALSQGLFAYHARRFNRFLLTLGYLVSGAMIGVGSGLLARPSLAVIWACIGALAFAGLWFRRRSLRGALSIVSYWLLVAIDMIGGFLEYPQSPENFSPHVEQILPTSLRIDA